GLAAHAQSQYGDDPAQGRLVCLEEGMFLRHSAPSALALLAGEHRCRDTHARTSELDLSRRMRAEVEEPSGIRSERSVRCEDEQIVAVANVPDRLRSRAAALTPDRREQ